MMKSIFELIREEDGLVALYNAYLKLKEKYSEELTNLYVNGLEGDSFKTNQQTPENCFKFVVNELQTKIDYYSNECDRLQKQIENIRKQF